jgi:hypothetical protein
MEFAYDSPRTAPDLAMLDAAIAAIDPAALVDLAPGGSTIRVATVMTRQELLACLEGSGLPADPWRLRQLPSVCCGGCSG